jgi:hypothetical protein
MICKRSGMPRLSPILVSARLQADNVSCGPVILRQASRCQIQPYHRLISPSALGSDRRPPLAEPAGHVEAAHHVKRCAMPRLRWVPSGMPSTDGDAIDESRPSRRPQVYSSARRLLWLGFLFGQALDSDTAKPKAPQGDFQEHPHPMRPRHGVAERSEAENHFIRFGRLVTHAQIQVKRSRARDAAV